MPKNLLTDSEYKKKQAIAAIDREVLIAERKKHQRKMTLRSDSTKIEVVKTYLALGGNATLTAAATKIPFDTIKTWKTTNWWNQLVNDMRKAEKLELSAKTKKILDKSLDLVMDRLDNGDFFYDQKSGQLVRKPIPARELNKIAVDMIDQKFILDKATEEQVELSTNEEKLAKLAERFAELAATALARKPAVEVTDVVFVEENHAKDEE